MLRTLFSEQWCDSAGKQFKILNANKSSASLIQSIQNHN